MNPLKVSAQCAAFVWFSSWQTGRPPNTDEALRFARDNWVAFLPSAHEGIGRLLIRVAQLDQPKAVRPRPRSARGKSRTRKMRLAAAQ
jgi:hypothetical protein